ncbi:MAG: hypothetical protein AB1942_05000 [Pseudomonadota bacterium]
MEGRAKPTHEAEWRRTVKRAFDGEDLTDAEIARLDEISTPAYETLGAPRVGEDAEADAWIIEVRKASTPDEIAAVLKEFRGYRVVALVTCDGVPIYSHGGQYEGVDETSFRGAILAGCTSILPQALIDDAWEHKLPEEAVSYGRSLLDLARTAQPKEAAPSKPGFLARFGLAKPPSDQLPFPEQVKAVDAAGRWFVYWGERGHAIRAWY